MENKDFLTEQIITYLGNKRSLLGFISEVIDTVKQELKKEKTHHLMFFRFRRVARFLKQHSSKLFVNDLEDYSRALNKCFLTNKNEFDISELEKWHLFLKEKIANNNHLNENGFFLQTILSKRCK